MPIFPFKQIHSSLLELYPKQKRLYIIALHERGKNHGATGLVFMFCFFVMPIHKITKSYSFQPFALSKS